MPKGGGKSSASSATRKKHARRAIDPNSEQPVLPKEKTKGKDKKNKEPRKKEYIPPVRPTPVRQDPLDTHRLASQLPPELVVVLRRFGKKDTVTKTKALEELHSGWVLVARKELQSGEDGEEGWAVSILVTMLPVWLHHLPLLLLHTNRRIRALTVGLHASLMLIPAVRTQIFLFLSEIGESAQIEAVVGSLCMAAHDVDRPVSIQAIRAWNDAFSFGPQAQETQLLFNESLANSLLSFLNASILDPSGVWLSFNPPPPPAVSGNRPSGGKAQVKKVDEDAEPSRQKGDFEEESEDDRKGRLRIGALGALKWILDVYAGSSDGTFSWNSLSPILSNRAVWTSLHHTKTSPLLDIESIGHAQPGVRKVGWLIVQSLLHGWKDRLDGLLPTVGSAVLRSAWVEPDAIVRASMWEPLLTLLTQFPQTWETDLTMELDQKYGHVDESESDEDEEAKPPHRIAGIMSSASLPRVSTAYKEFLQFLELGCSGSPLQGYPTIVVILSSLPSSILLASPFSHFFTSFWAAIDGRALSALDRSSASAAFLSSLLECLVFSIRRIRSGKDSPPIIANDLTQATVALVVAQFSRMWDELSSGRLRIDNDVVGNLFAKCLLSLNQVVDTLFQVAWDSFGQAIRSWSGNTTPSQAELVSTVLNVCNDLFTEQDSRPRRAVRSLIEEYADACLLQADTIFNTDPTPKEVSLSLIHVLNLFEEILLRGGEFTVKVDRFVIKHAPRLLAVSSPLLFTYLLRRADEQRCLDLWHSVLSSLSTHPETAVAHLGNLLGAARDKHLPRYLKPDGHELDALASKLLADALNGYGEDRLPVVSTLLQIPDHFLLPSTAHALFQSVVSAFIEHVDVCLLVSAPASTGLIAPLQLIHAVSKSHPEPTASADVYRSLLPQLFLLAYLLPLCESSPGNTLVYNFAKDLWITWVTGRPIYWVEEVSDHIKVHLRDLLSNVLSKPSPADLFTVIYDGCPGLHIRLEEIFPSRNDVDDELHALPSDPVDSSLAVVEPLFPSTLSHTGTRNSSQIYDRNGCSRYARLVGAVLQICAADRRIARENFWALRHFLALAFYANQLIQLPSASSPVFSVTVSPALLSDIGKKVQQVATYLLTIPMEDSWHVATTTAVLRNDGRQLLDDAGAFLCDLLDNIRRADTVRDSLILHTVLQHVLSGATENDADHWMRVARKLEDTSPQASLAVIQAIIEFAPEPPRLDRYRNELAAGILGIHANKANTEGLQLLRRLAATAPDPESDIVYLPQNRAVNLMKTCQQWIGSDEDMDEDLLSQMTIIFFHLAPILQNVPGSHWDLVFDVAENNLENTNFLDDSTLVTLARTLKLIIVVHDLSTSNKNLRASWQERQLPILTLVRDLLTTNTASAAVSVPRSICKQMALSIVQDLPSSLIDHDTLPRLCHLLADRSSLVQQMAYDVLRKAAKKRTEHFVVEAAVDQEGTTKIELPLELVDLLQRTFNDNEDGGGSYLDPLSYLLGWMVTFDLFIDASLKVKMAYVEQIRNLKIVSSHFLPTVFDLLRVVGVGGEKAFKLDVWAVDQYFIPLYDPETPLSLQLLAAHLYYRSLLTIPFLIRTWWLDCKDRQLSSGVANLTSHYFSPVIISSELSHIRSPEVDLADENMKIKVSAAINEVTATYNLDEQYIEIAVKIPVDFPLRGIDVREIRKVGIQENQWRAWIFGVQQIISSHNGRIVDGLSLFKKNITLHFEGQTECAICYSILNVTDGALPTKPCKTCKNRFHAACLYKWFKTSHASNCPLCRSNIL